MNKKYKIGGLFFLFFIMLYLFGDDIENFETEKKKYSDKKNTKDTEDTKDTDETENSIMSIDLIGKNKELIHSIPIPSNDKFKIELSKEIKHAKEKNKLTVEEETNKNKKEKNNDTSGDTSGDTNDDTSGDTSGDASGDTNVDKTNKDYNAGSGDGTNGYDIYSNNAVSYYAATNYKPFNGAL